MTPQEFEQTVTLRDRDSIQAEIFLPVVDSSVTACVVFDTGFDTISPRQLGCLNEFLSHSIELLPQIKEALFGHMTEYDQLYTDEGEYPYASIEEAFAVCSPSLLCINAENHPDSEFPILIFSPEWDREHGAEIWYHDGAFRYR